MASDVSKELSDPLSTTIRNSTTNTTRRARKHKLKKKKKNWDIRGLHAMRALSE